MTADIADAENLMTISISNLTVSTNAPIGTIVGTLALQNASGAGLGATYILTQNSAGFFAISGTNVVTNRTSIPPGYYSVHIHANGTLTRWSATANFLFTVTAT